MKADLDILVVAIIVLAVLVLCSVVKKVCRKILKGENRVNNQ